MMRPSLALRLVLTLGLAAAGSTATSQPLSPAGPQLDARFRLAMEAAFGRADTNQDGQLSRQEAEHFPAIAARFDALDVDKNNQLSLTEFEAGYTASS
jgi:hypothetical protein